jgi:hypothetical protein
MEEGEWNWYTPEVDADGWCGEWKKAKNLPEQI